MMGDTSAAGSRIEASCVAAVAIALAFATAGCEGDAEVNGGEVQTAVPSNGDGAVPEAGGAEERVDSPRDAILDGVDRGGGETGDSGGCAADDGAPFPTGGYRDIYVSPTGNDGNPGTVEQPLQTIAHARDLVRTLTASMSGDIKVVLRGGWYVQTSTLTFDERDSGQNGYDVIYQAYACEHPAISGGKLITGWALHDAAKNIWEAPAGDFDTRQLYVNAARAMRAAGPGSLISGATKTSTGYTLAGTSPLASWANPSAIEFVYNAGLSGVTGGPSDTWHAEWIEQRVLVDSISSSGGQTTITMQQPAWNDANPTGTTSYRQLGLPDFIENAYELLDQPGEWYLDKTAKTFFYIPRSGEDLSTSVVVAPALETIVSGIGAGSKLHNFRMQGLTFAHSTWLFPNNGGKGYIENQASSLWNDGVVPSSVVLRQAQDVRIERCVFVHLGGCGLELIDGVQSTAVIGCRFADISGSGVRNGGIDSAGADAVHKDDGNTIQDCYLAGLPAEYHGGVPVFLGYVSNALVSHNEIQHAPYTGISVGWGWGASSYAHDNQVLNNLVSYANESLADGGSWYALSPQPNSVLASNYFVHRGKQDRAGGCIYPDEGSSGWDIHDNVCDDVGRWLYIWTSSINGLNVHDNWSNSSTMTNNGTNITLSNNTTDITGQGWPSAAQNVIDAAGLEPAWTYVRTLADGTSVNPPPR